MKDYLDSFYAENFIEYIHTELYELIDQEISNVFENKYAYISCFTTYKNGGVDYLISIGGEEIEDVIGWSPDQEFEWGKDLEKVVFHKLLKKVSKVDVPQYDLLKMFSITRVQNDFPIFPPY